MYSIGQFSKMNRVSPKTLRHYDKLDLLKPSRIDRWTGYRYYHAEQLPRLGQILLLKDMGFSLQEIQELIDGNRDWQAAFDERKALLETEIKESSRKLDRVREYLIQQQGEQKMHEEILLKSLPEVTVASMRCQVENYNSFFSLFPAMGETMAAVGATCRDPFYCFALFHDGEYKEEDMDVEICEAVNHLCPDSAQVKFKIIPPVERAACLMHKGPYDRLAKSYNRIFDYLRTEGLEPAGPPRESYIHGIWNQESPEEWLTELQIPLG